MSQDSKDVVTKLFNALMVEKPEALAWNLAVLQIREKHYKNEIAIRERQLAELELTAAALQRQNTNLKRNVAFLKREHEVRNY